MAKAKQAKPKTKAAAPKAKKTKVAAPKANVDGLEFHMQYLDHPHCVARPLVQFCVYFKVAKKEALAPILEVFDGWLAIAGPDRLEWWRRDDRSKSSRFDARAAQQLRTYLAQLGADDRGAQLMHLDPPETDELWVFNHARARELDVHLNGRGSSSFSSDASWMRLLVSPDEVGDDPSRWLDLMLHACDKFPVASGLSSHVLVSGSARKQDATINKAIDDAVMRHPGVDIEDDLASLLVKPDRIKTVGWLTVLGTDAVAKVGGEAKLRRALADSATLHKTKHALVIQAGPRPEVDGSAGYRAVYSALRPLQEPLLAYMTPEGRAAMTRLG